MPVEDMAAVMADIAMAIPGTVADMPRRLMFEEETMALVFAGGVVTTLLGRRAAMRVMQGANIMPLAAAAGELTGQIRTTNIRVTAWAIMAWAIAIHTTVLAITVTAPVGATIRITDIVPADIILTDADIGHI